MANELQKDDTQADDIQNTTDNSSGAFEKFKQTISSSLLTAQDKGKQSNETICLQAISDFPYLSTTP